MSDILSKEEIDALMAEVGDEEGDEADAEEPEDLAESMEATPEEAADGDEPPLDELEGPSDLADEGEGEGGPLAPVGGEGRNLDLILAIPVEVSVELGRARMTVFDLLQLGQGSVIELDKMASELIDLTIDQRLLAKGEAVVINENFGFRCLEVEPVAERIRRL